ncbi:hypothetical protein RSOLAG22IIIB_02341 [Rhizoctonia solani]|uniref:Uncharacterized protein n=1 Tax=Rhizoctonia solani TaxID=456999 RepID=A0A0K6GEP5_9AGAM|nr:hypothetical protein RSOLAG22IIIB_02341 [Rhizoctonia solani]
MPYSEHAHFAPVGTVLSKLSAIRNALGNFVIPLLSDMPLPSADLHGKQAIVTGANSGIGFETAKALARMGAHVVLACRNKDKAENARKEIERAIPGAEIEVEIMDCASLGSVRQFVERWSERNSTRIDILVNNAGRVLNTRITTIDGYEDTYQANHLSHALLTLSLLQSGYFYSNARIVTVSSISFFSSPPLDAHNTNSGDIVSQYEEGAILPWESMVLLYSRAKACQAIWSMALQRKLQETEKWKDIVVQACHPGTVKSSMLSQSDGPGGSSGAALNAFKSFVNTFGISNEQGAVVPVWLAVAQLDEESTAALNPWKQSALRILDKLKDILKVCGTNLDVAERARVISLTAVFIGQDHFTDESCRNAAKDCLDRIGALDKTIAARVLNDHVKPLFQVSVHPGIHLDTGRVKHDAISIQNMYDEQPWKIKGAGCWNILVWVLSNMDSSDIETLWPLAIPPLLTLLDDFKPMYKLRGVDVTQALLKKAPPTLLRRTGVGELLFKSLLGALQNLTSDSAPELLRETTPCYLVLVDLVLPDDDLQRYAKLAELVTDVIIPGWLYASSRIEIMIESVYVLSLVVQALGAGSIRFLKAIIPQLTENLSPKEFSQTHTIRRLQIESAKCLLIVMVNARPRIPYWRVRILDGLLRCWVDVNEDTSDGMELEREELKERLISALRELLATSQSLLEDEISVLSTLDAKLFSGLVAQVQRPSIDGSAT